MARRFTLDRLLWRAWLTPVPLADCGEPALAALVESGPDAKYNDYYLTLVHDAPVLATRSRLFNSVMYGRRGLPRAERELAATAQSRLNGCVFCASVHGRLYARLSRDEETVPRLLEHGPAAVTEGRQKSIVDFAEALAAPPPTGISTVALTEAGLSDGDILDAIYAVSMFAWANRLMLTLGEAVPAPAEMQDRPDQPAPDSWMPEAWDGDWR